MQRFPVLRGGMQFLLPVGLLWAAAPQLLLAQPPSPPPPEPAAAAPETPRGPAADELFVLFPPSSEQLDASSVYTHVLCGDGTIVHLAASKALLAQPGSKLCFRFGHDGLAGGGE